jgi:hypothetical protein
MLHHHLHVASCGIHGVCIAFNAAVRIGAQGSPTSLHRCIVFRCDRRAYPPFSPLRHRVCIAAWLHLSRNPSAAGHCAQVVAEELSAGDAVRTARRVPV